MILIYLILFFGGLAYLFRKPLKYIIPAVALLVALVNWPGPAVGLIAILGVAAILAQNAKKPFVFSTRPQPRQLLRLPPPEPRVDLFRK